MRVTDENSAAVIIDVQERLFPHMDGSEPLLDAIRTLIQGLRVLDVPIVLTEQYPKGLGPTLSDVTELLPDVQPIIKAAFSCCDDAPFQSRLREVGRKVAIVAGIESHVCVLQTTIDLLEAGYEPVVVTDATSSRSPRDRDVAFRRMEREGARLTTVESILFELTRVSGTPRFKEISRLIK